jgi:hypothetical protein
LGTDEGGADVEGVAGSGGDPGGVECDELLDELGKLSSVKRLKSTKRRFNQYVLQYAGQAVAFG